eukprot:3033135-Rhodomonas_salina.2
MPLWFHTFRRTRTVPGMTVCVPGYPGTVGCTGSSGKEFLCQLESHVGIPTRVPTGTRVPVLWSDF